MTREIKFRAWHNKNNIMFNAVFIGCGKVFGMTKGKKPNSKFELENIELMQYTGLKDKNGKEIYEGDIIKFGNRMNPSESTEVKNQVVIWNNDKCCYDGIYPTLYPWRMCEVIGNIYENPELLNKLNKKND